MRRVRVAGGGTRTVEWRLPASKVPDGERLMALQDVRLALYGFPLADVSAPTTPATPAPASWPA
ncbi:hypothetical protein [Spirillospora sp. CA-128828]|uniref:hypothetical protein n=1 Tax=Spirillospora sp. CA-128828 TaxID=3240033 RepID=UPI003D8C2719